MTSTRGTAELGKGGNFEAGDAPVGLVPARPRADQGESLGDIIAAGAHVGRSPDRKTEPAGIGTVILEMPLQHGLGGALA